MAVDLKRELESFEDIPVISFGWVALFILFYIVLVGPLDYLLLKKVFKRLELTWITFPVLVLIVSVAAYATAYYFKGDDLRINKIDLVDIDLHGPGQVYGNSWFTLFSPRIQNYTIGLEPAAPGWAGRWSDQDADAPTPPVTIATMDGPDPALGGNTQSLFRRPYEYANDAGGLVGVPIPVWATRTFTASWRAPLTDAQQNNRRPLQAELRISRDGRRSAAPSPTICRPSCKGQCCSFRDNGICSGDLVPGEKRRLRRCSSRTSSRTCWVSGSPPTRSRPRYQRYGVWAEASLARLGLQYCRELLFHGAPGGRQHPNSGLRQFDEAWRLLSVGEGQQRRSRDEAILVARTPPRSDRAEAVAEDGVSPTRLWLDELPGKQQKRPALSGYLQQETYVRIYIPLVRSRQSEPRP